MLLKPALGYIFNTDEGSNSARIFLLMRRIVLSDIKYPSSKCSRFSKVMALVSLIESPVSKHI